MRYEATVQDRAAIDKWLSEGNKVQVCTPGERTDSEQITYTWGKKKKKAVDPKVANKKKAAPKNAK